MLQSYSSRLAVRSLLVVASISPSSMRETAISGPCLGQVIHPSCHPTARSSRRDAVPATRNQVIMKRPDQPTSNSGRGEDVLGCTYLVPSLPRAARLGARNRHAYYPALCLPALHLRPRVSTRPAPQVSAYTSLRLPPSSATRAPATPPPERASMWSLWVCPLCHFVFFL